MPTKKKSTKTAATEVVTIETEAAEVVTTEGATEIPVTPTVIETASHPGANAGLANITAQEMLDELLDVTGKTLSDEFSIVVPMDTTLEQAQELAARLYPKLREHWKAVTCYAQPRKSGAAIQVKVAAPKPEGTTDEKAPKVEVPVNPPLTITPGDGMSDEELVGLVLEATGKAMGETFSVPLHVDMELEQAQALATKLYQGFRQTKNWQTVSCSARARKNGCTIQLRVTAKANPVEATA